MSPLGLYIHIPFCRQKCYYCDFLSYQNQEKRIPDYLHALKTELVLYQKKYGKLYFDTIYIGGGTPSMLLGEEVTGLLSVINDHFLVDAHSEITIEVNPGDLSQQLLAMYMESGINRISLGVQTTDEELLKKLNRDHTNRDILRSVQLMGEAGLENYSFDLIFGLPNQSIEGFQRDLKQILSLQPAHLSLYSLIVEPNTYFHRLESEGQLLQPAEEEERAMYHWAIEHLRGAGYSQYEISNFARPGYASRHNLKYWRNQEYIGVGLGSSSHFDGARYSNTRKFSQYADRLMEGELPILEREIVTAASMEVDYLIMNLRLIQGIRLSEYQERFGVDFMERYGRKLAPFLKSGHLLLEGNCIRMSTEGFDISNTILVELI